MREIYLCELCEAISGWINLYCIVLAYLIMTILPRPLHATTSHVLVSVARQTVTLFNASDFSSHGDGSASLFPSHGVLAYSQRNSTRRYHDTVGKCCCPTQGATERLRKSKPYTVFTAVYYHWKICFQAFKRSCSEEVQGKRRRWSARREVPLNIQSLLPGWHHCSALLPYLNEGCKGRAHCLSAMFDPSKELVH